jgi:Spy/CpxP family protein refolding chaperone
MPLAREGLNMKTNHILTILMLLVGVAAVATAAATADEPGWSKITFYVQ